MIFVTVGTHEQPFNRLIEAIDKLVENKQINEKVIIQKGYSTYEPKYCECYDLIPWDKMQEYTKQANVVITHGGPASYMDVLAIGKKPIVVPRQKKYDEHVNDHQLEFALELKKRGISIEVIDDIEDLFETIEKSKNIKCSITLNKQLDFSNKLESIVKKLF